MGGLFAKASAEVFARVSATLLANFNPKLHNEIKTNLENTMTNTANADIDVNTHLTCKLFSDGYIHANTSGNIYLGGSVGMLLLAMILTGNIRFFLALLFLLLMVALGSIAFAVRVQDQLMEACQAPEKKCSALLVADPNMASALIEKFLKVKDPHKKFANDADCVAVTQLMHGIVRFQLEYHKVSYFLPADKDSKPLQEIAGEAVPEEFKKLTLRQAGERINGKMCKIGQDFCKSYHGFRRLMTKSLTLLEHHIELHSQMDSKLPINEDKVKRILNVDELKGFTEVITADTSNLLEEASFFLDNVYRDNKLQGDAQALIDDVMKCERELDQLFKDLQGKEDEYANLQGQKTRLEEKKQHIQKAQEGVEDSISYYKQRRCDVSKALEAAVKDEKSYTFWMFGVRAFVWENDVKLAQDKIKRFTSERDGLDETIHALNMGGDQKVAAINKDMETTVGELSALKERIEYIQADIRSIKAKASNRAKHVQNQKAKLASIMDQEGMMSVIHLFIAQKALNSFAQTSKSDAATADAFSSGWKHDIKAVVAMVEDIVDAPSLKEQRDVLWKLRQILSREKIPLFAMIQKTATSFTLTPDARAYDKYWCVEEEFRHSVLEPFRGQPAALQDGQRAVPIVD